MIESGEANLSKLKSLAVHVLAHAGAHIFWTVRFGAYAPGVVTSVLLIIPDGACRGSGFLHGSSACGPYERRPLVPKGALA